LPYLLKLGFDPQEFDYLYKEMQKDISAENFVSLFFGMTCWGYKEMQGIM
jgi:hypothetical protein